MALFLAFFFCFFFFNDTATTEIYTLSLHDALPNFHEMFGNTTLQPYAEYSWRALDRKSTRLNSSHITISYAVFCLKKKNTAKYTLFEHHDNLHGKHIDDALATY